MKVKVEELKACVELIETAPAAYLTTIGQDGYPHTRAMLNLRNRQQYPNQVHLYAAHQDDLMIYFSTNTSSIKLRQIEANPRVCVYYCHPEQFHGLALIGDIELVDDAALRKAVWNEGWERYYLGGPDDPDHTILRLYPQLATGWHKAARFEFSLRSV
jgi:general stress protein 26